MASSTRSHHHRYTSPSIFIFLCLLQIHSSYAQDAVKGGYWVRDSGITASAIDSTLFTYLFCAFADVNAQTGEVTISSANAASFSTFTSTVRQKNPSVKTLLSIGGGTVNSSVFNSMASQPSTRSTFITSSINLARSNGFSGLDLDWENLTTASEMSNMAVLLNEWRAAVDSESTSTGNTRLILTAAVANAPQLNSAAIFPVSTIKSTLDFVNVMSYDFAAPSWSGSMTRAPAALTDPTGNDVSGSDGVQAWINAGLPTKQIALGFPFYGYAWKLTDPANHGILAPASGIDSSVGDPKDGSIQYNKILSFISGKNAAKVFDSSYVTNYCYSGTTWIGYDDTQTIAQKVSYAKSQGLRGYFAWQVAGDSNWALSRQALQTWGA